MLRIFRSLVHEIMTMTWWTDSPYAHFPYQRKNVQRDYGISFRMVYNGALIGMEGVPQLRLWSQSERNPWEVWLSAFMGMQILPSPCPSFVYDSGVGVKRAWCVSSKGLYITICWERQCDLRTVGITMLLGLMVASIGSYQCLDSGLMLTSAPL